MVRGRPFAVAEKDGLADPGELALSRSSSTTISTGTVISSLFRVEPPGWPPDALADGEQAGGDQDGAYQQRVEQHAERHRGADLGDAHFLDLGERGEGACQHYARRGDHSAGDAESAQRAAAQAQPP